MERGQGSHVLPQGPRRGSGLGQALQVSRCLRAKPVLLHDSGVAEGQCFILRKHGPKISSFPQTRPFKGPSQDSVINILQRPLSLGSQWVMYGVWAPSSSQMWELQGVSEVTTFHIAYGVG